MAGKKGLIRGRIPSPRDPSGNFLLILSIIMTWHPISLYWIKFITSCQMMKVWPLTNTNLRSTSDAMIADKHSFSSVYYARLVPKSQHRWENSSFEKSTPNPSTTVRSQQKKSLQKQLYLALKFSHSKWAENHQNKLFISKKTVPLCCKHSQLFKKWYCDKSLGWWV